MELILKIGSLLSLLVMTYQDIKERKISLYLFFLAGIFTLAHYSRHTTVDQLIANIAFNVTIILGIIGVLSLYTWCKVRLPLFEVFGMGDFLFFLVFALGFPTSPFIILFVSSLIFSLLVFLFFKDRTIKETVPLAGLQAFFLALILSVNWLFNFINLYK